MDPAYLAELFAADLSVDPSVMRAELGVAARDLSDPIRATVT